MQFTGVSNCVFQKVIVCIQSIADDSASSLKTLTDNCHSINTNMQKTAAWLRKYNHNISIKK